MKVSGRRDSKKPAGKPTKRRSDTPSSPNYKSRLKKVRRFMVARDVPALLVTKLANIRYLTGFTGSSAMLLLTHDSAIFITDGRYEEQSYQELASSEFDGKIVVYGANGLAKTMKEATSIIDDERLFLEADSASWGFVLELSRWLEGLHLLPSSNLIERVRAAKDAWEISRLKEAARLTDLAYSEALSWIVPGITERHIALRLVDFFEHAGAEGISFEPIVASGVRSALPHAKPTEKKIDRGELVVLDFGCRIEGYCSDMTRTVFVGRADRQTRRMYALVRRANHAGIEALSANRMASTVDAAVRRVISAEGMGEFFVHSTGHGLGIDVHEWPRIGRGVTDRIPLDCVVTIEPGVYLPGTGGVRIEDMVVAKRSGRTVLTESSRRLVEL